MTANIDSGTCPLCEQANQCEVDSLQGCWCMNTQVPEALLQAVPASFKGVSCICNNCIQRYLKQES